MERAGPAAVNPVKQSELARVQRKGKGKDKNTGKGKGNSKGSKGKRKGKGTVATGPPRPLAPNGPRDTSGTLAIRTLGA